MLNKKVLDALNKQLNAELYSSYEYLSMAAFFEEQNLEGMAKWMKVQSREEYGHAMKIYEYILQAGGKIDLKAIKEPTKTFKTPLDVFEATYDHEKSVTKSIYETVETAMSEKDHATNIFLHWFVTEQVEEEATALKIVDKLKMLSDTKSGLYLIDRELGQRASA